METEEILGHYDNEYKLRSEFLSAIEALLKTLLNRYGINVHSVDSRLKERASLERKLNGDPERYDSFSAVKDVCGLRVITYFIDQVELVSTLIHNEFDVDPKHSVDKRILMDPDRFGYISVHYVVKLLPDRLELTEYRHFSDCETEIQVRSILQHAWAEIEHDLGYKTKEAIPKKTRRRFSRLAGLLEIADDEFVSIRKELANYESLLAEQISKHPEQVKIDPISLHIYLTTSKLVDKVNKRIESSTKIIFEKEFIPPLTEYTIRRLRYLHLTTILDIDTALSNNEDKIVYFAKNLVVPAGLEEGGYLCDTCLFYLCYALLSNSGSIDYIRKFVNRFVSKNDEDFAQFILKAH